MVDISYLHGMYRMNDKSRHPDKMQLTVSTWNINSVRLRMDLVCRFLREYCPDVLCLQEIKSPEEFVDRDRFREAGYGHCIINGQKGYNGVMILSRWPMKEHARRYIHGKDEARHIAGRLENGIIVENFYVPAGGYVPDADKNEKFADKLAYLDGLREWTGTGNPQKSILVGDLNVAPLEEDVWSHRQLLNVVSHTPVETSALADVLKAGNWTDITRKHLPSGKLYSWWSYRARDWNLSDRGRRLDHVWASEDIAGFSTESHILRDVRGWPRPSDHVPVLASFDLPAHT